MSIIFSKKMKIKENMSASLIFKGINILIAFLMVPLLIGYLNPESYGVWILISSIVSWISLFDIGIGNGLRNKLVESISSGNPKLSQVYVSTSYAIICLVSLATYILFISINLSLDWQQIFNVKSISSDELNLIVVYFITFFLIQSILQLLNVIFISHQKSAYKDALSALTAVLTYFIVYRLTLYPNSGLIGVSISYGLVPVLVLMASSLFFYKLEYKKIKPLLRFVDFKCAGELMNLGVKFYIIQIAAVILLASDNIIIAQVLGPKEVAIYNVAFKYFSLPIILFTVISTPYWSAFTAAKIENEHEWVASSIAKLKKLWLFLVVGVLLMVLMSEYFYSIWVGSEIKVPLSLSIGMAFYAILLTWGSIYVTYLNGVGKVRLQMYETFFIVIFNIPMSIYFSDNLGLGSVGVVLGTCVSLSIGAILMPIQTGMLLRNTAKGVWDK